MTAEQRLLASVHDGIEFQEMHLRYQRRDRLVSRILWNRQREIIQALEEFNVVSVKGCHGSGKTFVASGIALRWLIKHTTGKVFITAPTLRQVKTFIGEIELARQHLRLLEIYPKLLPPCSTTGLKLAENRYILGASSSRGVNIAGLHGDDVLIITDESPGIQADIWDTIEGIRLAGRVKMLKLGNPVVPSGPFFDDFTKYSRRVKGITISAFDTPNLYNREAGRPFTIEELLAMTPAQLDDNCYPFLITRAGVVDRYLTWGPDHPSYVARVLGQFPTQSEWSVFSLEWIEKAVREPTDEELLAAVGHWIQVGIDVAGGGEDESSLCARVDGIILEQCHYRSRNPGGEMLADLKRIRHKYADLYPMGPIFLDIVGVGLNVGPQLAQEGFFCVGFQAGAGHPRDAVRFDDNKAEAYWTAREFFENLEICGLEDLETKAQLGTVMYEITNRGKIAIESKKKAKARGISSPDRAEALIQAFIPYIPSSQYIEYGDRALISLY